MAEFVGFSLQICAILFSWCCLERNPINDFETVTLDSCPLGRIVREETDRADSKVNKYLRSHSIVPGIRRKTKLHVRFDGIASLVL